MDQSPTSKAHTPNIETIVRLEAEAEEQISSSDRFSAAIGRFAGTNTFVVAQVVFVLLWIAINTRALTVVSAFDPYPFPMLSLLLGLEAVFLAAFVLIRQNRMSLRADQRSHLDLQINLLTEKEVTKIIQLLQTMNKHLGISEHHTDAETRQLGKDTAVEDLARDVRENFSEERAPPDSGRMPPSGDR